MQPEEDSLDSEQITKFLTTTWRPQIHVLDQVTSTITYASEHALPNWAIVVANEQTAGKGRRGHRFESPAGTGIYLTFMLPVSAQHLKNPGVLTASIAVAVWRAIKRVSGIQLAIKWLNDLYLPAGKCGGILVETVNDAANCTHQFIVGIGLNVRQLPKMPPLDQPICGIGIPMTISRNELIAAIYSECCQLYRHFDSAAILNSYRQHCLWYGRQVTAQVAGKAVAGRVLGVNDRAQLLLAASDQQVLALDATVAHTIRLQP
ncbi:MAG: biotin--[acetyl-CoA-carboxylase] ligase [Lactobacillus sp.]|nr:biotin--[acetyl-CoA-carboxylase] ligase [Lactobacillus sp.]MDN6052806.1 biotin--[acetyl-CoA-carboxylase] ligase [Lactobacillus sp.]